MTIMDSSPALRSCIRQKGFGRTMVHDGCCHNHNKQQNQKQSRSGYIWRDTTTQLPISI